MQNLNYPTWEASLRMEFRSFMFRNFTTIGGTVAEVEEAIGDVFNGRDERLRI